MVAFVNCKNKDRAISFFRRKSIFCIETTRLDEALDVASKEDFSKVMVFREDCVFEARFFVMFMKILEEIDADAHGELYYLGSENIGPTFSRSKKGLCA